MVAVWLGPLWPPRSWSPSSRVDSGSVTCFTSAHHAHLLFPPCYELHVEDGLNCVAFGVFSSECFIFQLLLWHSPACHCRSFQSWSRRGSAHLLLHDSSHPWIRSVLLCNEVAFFQTFQFLILPTFATF